MTKRGNLQIGDKIRIVAVPESDELAYKSGSDFLKETLDVLRWMVGKIFTISIIDEYHPWVEFEYKSPSGELTEHSMAMMDDDSWEIV